VSVGECLSWWSTWREVALLAAVIVGVGGGFLLCWALQILEDRRYSNRMPRG
jgi:hypothetical protein